MKLAIISHTEHYRTDDGTIVVQNQQPGAEEAFKILGHAFDLIGESVSL